MKIESEINSVIKEQLLEKYEIASHIRSNEYKKDVCTLIIYHSLICDIGLNNMDVLNTNGNSFVKNNMIANRKLKTYGD